MTGEFIYVGDPMCSWCWGFAPTLDRMQEVYQIPIRLVVGGLRPGPGAEVLDDRLAAYLAHHWEAVAEASGQPFDHGFLERRDGWRYDTELPDIAAVVMREMVPGAALEFFSRLQRAFYAEGVDLTDPAAYPPLVAEFDAGVDEFMRRLLSPEGKEAAYEDFFATQAMGIRGFPTLLYEGGDQRVVITRGFAPADKLLPVLSDWLISQHADDSDGLFCEPGVVC